MPRKDRSKRSRVRDLSGVRSTRNRSLNGDGSRKGSVSPAFRASIINGHIPFLVTRNGKRVDRRTHAGRRFEALIQAIVQDMGGPENVSTAEAQLVRRAAALAIDLEFQEAEAIRDNVALDPDTYRTMASTQRQILQALGLRRRSRDITPNPLDYAKSKTIEAEVVE